MIDPISIIGGVGSLAGAIGGAIASKVNNDKARLLMQQRRASLDAEHEAEQNKSARDRIAYQQILNDASKNAEERFKRAAATNAVAGGTDEAVAQQKAAANEAEANMLSNMAVAEEQRKDAEKQVYEQRKDALTQQEQQTYLNQGAAAAQAGAQVANAGINLVGIGLQKKA